MLSAVDTEIVLADYDTLRVVEARCRWLRGHAIETLDTDDEALASVADLVEPGLAADALLERVEGRDRNNPLTEKWFMSATVIRSS